VSDAAQRAAERIYECWSLAAPQFCERAELGDMAAIIDAEFASVLAEKDAEIERLSNVCSRRYYLCEAGDAFYCIQLNPRLVRVRNENMAKERTLEEDQCGVCGCYCFGSEPRPWKTLKTPKGIIQLCTACADMYDGFADLMHGKRVKVTFEVEEVGEQSTFQGVPYKE
jgi:hypothetical protein